MASAREAYLRIRNYLAGRNVGATRDEALVEELVKCLLCQAELDAAAADDPAAGYAAAFARVRARMPGVFDEADTLQLDADALAFIHAQLDGLDLRSPGCDPIGDAYEVFVGAAARGAEGQFFTPQNAIRLLVELIAPAADETIVDPACGAGGFLSYVARERIAGGASPGEVATRLWGIDKDRYLARLASAHLHLITGARPQVSCADALAWRAASGHALPFASPEGRFDVVLANPPFGARIVAASESVRAGFDLAHRFVERDGELVRSDRLQRSSAPQILFLERCLELARPGGRIGLVVPESMVSSPSHRYAVAWLRARAEITAVVGMPEELFKTSGKGGTHTKTVLLALRRRAAEPSDGRGVRVFMAEAAWCGHDSRGRTIDRDDLPTIARRHAVFRDGQVEPGDRLGHALEPTQLRDHVLSPRYYDPEIDAELAALEPSHALVEIAALEAAGAIAITTGDEVGKLAYGTGDVPFVRTSDLSNWEIKLDPKHCVSEAIHRQFATKQDVREGDILMVRDGSYLIGTCAYVTGYDTRIVVQSHLYKLRVAPEHDARLTPQLLLALLSSAPVRRQIRAKRYTQDIIDSLGDRVRELVLPIPRSAKQREKITKMVDRVIHDRVEARELARRAALEVVQA